MISGLLENVIPKNTIITIIIKEKCISQRYANDVTISFDR